MEAAKWLYTPMWKIKKDTHTYMITISTDADPVVRVLGTDGAATAIVLDPAYIGAVVPVTVNDFPLFMVCYLPTADVEHIVELEASQTLFVTQHGGVITNSSELTFTASVDGTLNHSNPRDVRWHVILNADVDKETNLVRYDADQSRLSSEAIVKLKSITVYRPFKGMSVYSHVSDGLDSLEYVDLELGDVIHVTFLHDARTHSEYVRV